MNPDTHCGIDGCSKPTYARGMCCAHYKRHLKTRPHGTARPRRPGADAGLTLTARTSLPELLAALAAAVPPLPGAHCRGHTRLFDTTIGHAQKVDTREARAAALGLCATCPALDPCRAWLDRLPDHHRPTGVVAGQIINPAIPANPRKKATP